MSILHQGIFGSRGSSTRSGVRENLKCREKKVNIVGDKRKNDSFKQRAQMRSMAVIFTKHLEDW